MKKLPFKSSFVLASNYKQPNEPKSLSPLLKILEIGLLINDFNDSKK